MHTIHTVLSLNVCVHVCTSMSAGSHESNYLYSMTGYWQTPEETIVTHLGCEVGGRLGTETAATVVGGELLN